MNACVEKISLSFAALIRSISFSTLEINFIYFFAVRYPCFLANQIASFAVRFFTIRDGRLRIFKVNKKLYFLLFEIKKQKYV
jgi:hypothetical protein